MKIAFHTGYHKTGTSWLQNVFFSQSNSLKLVSNSKSPWKDPVIRYLILTRDINFEQNKCRELIFKQIDKYNSSKATDGVFIFSAERLSGHPFSGGFDSYRIADRIHAALPEAKILCCVRNQVDMLISVYKQLIAEGYRGGVKSLFNTTYWKSAGFDLRHFEYDLLIGKYIKLFGKNKVLVLPYERMKSDIDAYLKDICTFFITEYQRPLHITKILNKSLSDWSIPILRILNHFKKTEMNPFPIYILPKVFQRNAVRICRIIPGRSSLFSDEIKQKIIERYYESNLRLKKMIDLDLNTYAWSSCKYL